MEHEYFTVQEAAERLRMKEKRIREAIGRGDLRAYRVGAGTRGAFRISREDLNDWLTRRATKPRNTGDVVEARAS